MANNKPAKTNTEKLRIITEQLPEFTDRYFYSGKSKKAILTRISYALDLKYFFEFAIDKFPYFPDKTIKELTIDDLKLIQPTDINDFTTWMDEKQKLSPRTVARRRSSIASLYKYLIDTERKLDYNPVVGSESIEIPESDYVSYLKLEEQDKLIDCIKNGTGLTGKKLALHDKFMRRDLAIVFLFLDTGLRISELQALNIKDVVMYRDLYDKEKDDFHLITIRKGKKKTKQATKVFFSDEAGTYITEYLESRKAKGENFTEESPLFTTLEGKRLSIRQIQHMLEDYVKASVKREDISVHKLRSSFAMEFYKSEHDLLVLQSRMGHSTIAATNIYAKASDKEDAVKESRNWRNKTK